MAGYKVLKKTRHNGVAYNPHADTKVVRMKRVPAPEGGFKNEPEIIDAPRFTEANKGKDASIDDSGFIPLDAIKPAQAAALIATKNIEPLPAKEAAKAAK